MEDDLMILQNVLIKNFETFQTGVATFTEKNKELVNVHIKSVGCNEQRLVLQAYMDYISGLFSMLKSTTEIIKDMMVKMRNTRNIFVANIGSIETSPSGSESTITGYKNGFTSINSPSPSNECNGLTPFIDVESIINLPNLPCGRVDTSNLSTGSIISKASVTSVHLDKLCFHICLPNSEVSKVLSKLYNGQDRITYNCPPVSGIPFGMNFNGGILRAMRCPPVSSGKVFLLDFGDIVEMEINLKNIFHLTKEEENVPAQAILCKLFCPKGFTESEMVHEIYHLNSLLFKLVSFRVVEKKYDVLHLELLSDLSLKEELSKNNNIPTPSRTNVNGEISSTTNPNQLSVEEMEMLYEEPLSTSNALMAVTGYVPKDDQRICRFYDPKIDGCFKGKNCRQKHVPLSADHTTKDLVPANAFSEAPTRISREYQPNEILKVKVTHITNLEYFYGIILKNSRPIEQLVFTDRDIKSSDHLKRLPLEYDIVLAKFDSDKLWYRAQVRDVNVLNETIEVFYIDYGNYQTVALKNLARCTEVVAKIPPQVQQFHLANISIIFDSEKDVNELKGMGLLCDMILEKEIQLRVVEHSEDLEVEFFDTPYSEIPQLLNEMHCIKLLSLS